ncbi:hypothetical protein [uncultured Parasphingopyxis sp.]|uniref:hypothetical protein n=1 Tax=uncultured Parasphingopyxis sp. TaxID=1547918 RepID=UPI00261DA2A6|nr:hypothetical protein [uncultured Parasphingopyxis sp.]
MLALGFTMRFSPNLLYTVAATWVLYGCSSSGDPRNAEQFCRDTAQFGALEQHGAQAFVEELTSAIEGDRSVISGSQLELSGYEIGLVGLLPESDLRWTNLYFVYDMDERPIGFFRDTNWQLGDFPARTVSGCMSQFKEQYLLWAIENRATGLPPS